MFGIDRNAACKVDRDEALRYLGYGNQALSSQMEARIDESIAHCESAARPAWCYRIFPVEHEGGEVVLKGSALSLGSDDDAGPIVRADQCAVMACTLGLGFEREARSMAATDAAAALLFDAAGSSLVEACADACERAVYGVAARLGLHAGQRTSPGYGKLPVALQEPIVRALDAGKLLGVSPTGSGMLIPAKSVTAFVGLFGCEEDARRARRSCDTCLVAPHCRYREEGNPCNP